MTERKILAENVRLRRHTKEWDQGVLAKKVGVSQPLISEIEAAKANPSLEVIEKIAKALGISISKLFEKIKIV